MVVLEAATVAAQMGWMNKDKFQKIFRETYSKAFPDFDLEQVFWQTIYAEGLFVVASLVWRASEAYRTFIGLWEGDVAIIGTEVYDTTKGEVTMPLISGTFPYDFYCPEGFKLVRGPSSAACVITAAGREAGLAEGEELEKGKPFEAMIAGFLDEVLVGKYFGYALMAIPALFFLLELKNWKKRKRARGMLK